MAPTADRWDDGQDEQVEVNQRALIDKVLARYAAEFTVFRELLQNSDDARAKAVEIRFETKEYTEREQDEATTPPSTDQDLTGTASAVKLSNLKTTHVHRWTFRNNGIVFRDEDWSRLKKIADGNPDEDKIGAFGVGFYSLFSVTEEPRVMSGDKGMRFYFKDGGDQLVVRRRTLDPSEVSEWTTFEMNLRESGPIPNAFDFIRFLTSSITFMTHLSDVSVFFDDRRLGSVRKSPGSPRPLDLPRGLSPSSPQRMMFVRGLQTTPLRITAEVMRWVHTVETEKPPIIIPKDIITEAPRRLGGMISSFWSALSGSSTPQRTSTPALNVGSPVSERTPSIAPDDSKLLEIVTSRVTLSIFTAEVDVRVDRKLTAELLRSTKKNPPSKLRYELIYTGKAEYDASKEEDEKEPATTGSVFQGLRADLDGTGAGRVFIGHATTQTTGLGGHMSSRFIPTVERESVDLVDRHVAAWNKELLFVGGYLARAAYEIEMSMIHQLWQGAAPTTGADRLPDIETRGWLEKRALHALKFFTFHPSTPSHAVSAELEQWFFACSGSRALPIMSSVGVRSAAEVRIPDQQFAGFLKNLPTIPQTSLQEANVMMHALVQRNLVKHISIQDIIAELGTRSLSTDEATACLRWWIAEAQKYTEDARLPGLRSQMLEAIIVSTGTPGSPDEQIVKLSTVKTFINTRRVPGALFPLDGPLPPALVPVSLSNNFTAQELTSAFPWSELSLVAWLYHITSPAVTNLNPDHDINRSITWAERVLNVIAKAWNNVAKEQHQLIIELLKDKTCIPTSAGLKKPSEAYFSTVNLFQDLPVILSTLKGGALDRLLEALGVRRHVEIQLVFDRMMKTGDWTISDLVKYFTSVQHILTRDEFNRLASTKAFMAEEPEENPKAWSERVRCEASKLYEPLPAFKELGLPTLDWGNQVKWKGGSEEAKFLYKLGLKRYPPTKEIIQLAASSDPIIRSKALSYFFENFHRHYADFDIGQYADVPFIPTRQKGTPHLAKPKEVFVNADWATLGFYVVDADIKNDALTKLRLHENPQTTTLVSLLRDSPPRDENTARQWFSILAGRIPKFSDTQLELLGKSSIVPVKSSKDDSSVRMLPPNQCYFLKESKGQFHTKLFVSIDFGPQANSFLSACGTKDEPSVEEIATILINNPRQFYELAEGRDNFLVELRNIAINRRAISVLTMSRMKQSPILLASRRKTKGDAKGFAEAEDESWDMDYDLMKARDIIIVDDPNEYQYFGDAVFCCPQEDLLESFYEELGSRRISSLVKQEYRVTAEIKSSKVADDVRSRVLERLPLFLHEHTHGNQRVDYKWLNKEGNFVVRTFGKLNIIKVLKFGTASVSRTLEASAVAKEEGTAYGKRTVHLLLSGNTQVDMYEVANSLCRVIFSSPKKNDALLFSAILSTDLSSLRRRGYDVERILKQQKAEREAAREAAQQARPQSTALVSDTSPSASLSGTSEKALAPQDTKAPPATPQAASSKGANHPPMPGSLDDTTTLADTDNSRPDARPRPVSTLVNSFKDFRRKLGDATSARGLGNMSPGQPGTPTSDSATSAPSPGLLPPPSTGAIARPASPSGHVTPLQNIQANISNAIQACRPETRGLLRNREQMQRVKETLNEGYCDVTGHSMDLKHVGAIGDFKLYVSSDYPDPSELMVAKRQVLLHFVPIIRRLSELYKLPPTSLHIFYDQVGSTIAFNGNGSLFCNARYFEAWHNTEVSQGSLSGAYISWYFTLAHEIAHNLVQPHNSEHEFYFSAICEAHVMGLGKLLSETGK